ncbi:LysE family translocator [Rhodococcus sp. IEGM 248]|uniref:LysE family translocator n=1 Tax=Rhodococcus opacus TaxID=37919 RepID=UPI0013BF8126|nr:LysE family translocator [Rhodococcus opacus]MDV7083072.1 LysE family translocator [Rhodococcus opacus]NDV03220.1 LysE family translocator [Rhodococcus sp. IEGM 248]
MIDSAAVLGVAAIALGMVLTPGPNMVYLVSRSITQGRAAGLVSLAGVALGFLCYLAAATLGISAVFSVVPQAYTALKLAGACYLGWLAWQALRPGGHTPFAPARTLLPRDSSVRLLLMGLTTNLLNPKIAVMYLALIPQFVHPGAGPVWLQSLLLGTVQIVVALTVNALIVCVAGTVATFLSGRPVWLRAQKFVMGSVLGGLAVHLALDRTRPATV